MAITKNKHESCCADTGSRSQAAQPHPDHSEMIPRLKKVQGQIEGLQGMIEDGRYCVDILVQFRAAMAALRKVEAQIFQTHLSHCVKDALSSKNAAEAQAKIDELTELLVRRTSL